MRIKRRNGPNSMSTSNEVSKYSNAIQIHYATTEPKYSFPYLQNILYGEELPFTFKPVNTTEMKKITKSSEENEYFMTLSPVYSHVNILLFQYMLPQEFFSLILIKIMNYQS